MKWVLISSKQSLLQEFHLVDNGTSKAVLKYNPVHHSARMSCEGCHRLFYIESTGSLTGKYIFKNEYDMETGHMNYDKWFGNKGAVCIESKRYNYTIENNPSTELVIYDGDSGLPLLNCDWTTPNSSAAALPQANSHTDNTYLLLGLCWYLSLPVARANRVEYAA
jgi:hypothetical protein